MILPDAFLSVLNEGEELPLTIYIYVYILFYYTSLYIYTQLDYTI